MVRRTVQLGENEHSVAVMRSLRQMKHEEDHCDFTIMVQKHRFRVHKCIIAAVSPYFKAMLKHDTKESREGKVLMQDVDYECVESCVDFMYSGKYDIPDGKIAGLLHVALILQLNKIKDSLHDILNESLNAENFYETRGIAEHHNLQTLLSKCKKFYEDNLMLVSTRPGFTKEKKSRLVNILKANNLKLTEEEKLKISLQWVGENSGRKENLLELIKLIKLPEISSEYLGDLLMNHPFISNDFRLYKLINSPLVENARKGIQSSAPLPTDKVTKKTADRKETLVLFSAECDLLYAVNQEEDTLIQFHERNFKEQGHCYTPLCKDPYIYLLYGNKSVRRLNYRDKTSNWENMQPMTHQHGYTPPSASLCGSFYVIGSSEKPTKDVEKYDPDTDKWSRLQDKPEAIAEAAIVALGDSIYCIGGWTQNRLVESSSKFTPTTSEWENFQPLLRKRRRCSAVAAENKIYVMGGYRNNFGVPDVECYNLVSEQWTLLSPAVKAISSCTLHHLYGWIFCVGDLHCQERFTKYDISNNKWHVCGFDPLGFYNIYNAVTVPV